VKKTYKKRMQIHPNYIKYTTNHVKKIITLINLKELEKKIKLTYIYTHRHTQREIDWKKHKNLQHYQYKYQLFNIIFKKQHLIVKTQVGKYKLT
jgi:hypothetical protein